MSNEVTITDHAEACGAEIDSVLSKVEVMVRTARAGVDSIASLAGSGLRIESGYRTSSISRSTVPLSLSVSTPGPTWSSARRSSIRFSDAGREPSRSSSRTQQGSREARGNRNHSGTARCEYRCI